MFDRRFLFVATAASAFAATMPAYAATAILPFDQAGFLAAQKAGKPVLVVVSASWCPTCKAQQPILNGLLVRPDLKDLVMFEVDFDSRKDVLRALNVRSQSTLIAYKGTLEVGRSVGDTKVESVTAMVKKSV